jgi:hypothetical protein
MGLVANRYNYKAVTLWDTISLDGLVELSRVVLQYHRSINKRRFNFLARNYFDNKIVTKFGRPARHRVLTEDRKGKILFDTDRGDYVNQEVSRVRRAKKKNLPLYIGQLKTQAGINELERRLHERDSRV